MLGPCQLWPVSHACCIHTPGYRGTLLIRNSTPLGTFNNICLGPFGAPRGGGVFLGARYPCMKASSPDFNWLSVT